MKYLYRVHKRFIKSFGMKKDFASKKPTKPLNSDGAEEKTRTSTGIPPLDPEPIKSITCIYEYNHI
jgi:hypothetical protein